MSRLNNMRRCFVRFANLRCNEQFFRVRSRYFSYLNPTLPSIQSYNHQIKCSDNFASSYLIENHRVYRSNLLLAGSTLFSSNSSNNKFVFTYILSRSFSTGIVPRYGSEVVPSSALSGKEELILNYLPEKPNIDDLSQISNGLEPTFSSLGLATWWPSGRFQLLMEYIHVGLDVPWWSTLIIVTTIVRMCTFPLVVMAQRNSAKLNNCMPQMQVLQARLSEARKRGDMYESAQTGMELQKFMKDHQINPLKNVAPMLIQIPVFMSMFFGLRSMCNLPVSSLKSGGILWFIDLSVPDPFYVLPFLTSVSMWLQFKWAVDGANLQQAGPIMKVFMQIMPFALFPMTFRFPAAITFYWFTTNIISVLQSRVVRIGYLREKLGIPKLRIFKKDELPIQQQSFREGIRESIDNWKVQADIADRRTYDEQAFREAGLTKPKRTFKYDPTKINLPSSTQSSELSAISDADQKRRVHNK